MKCKYGDLTKVVTEADVKATLASISISAHDNENERERVMDVHQHAVEMRPPGEGKSSHVGIGLTSRVLLVSL